MLTRQADLVEQPKLRQDRMDQQCDFVENPIQSSQLDAELEKGPKAGWIKPVSEALRHPAVLTLLGFVLTTLVGGFLTYRFNEATQTASAAESIRSNAIAAVTEISDLVSERRERAALVISSIRRAAPAAEIEARKAAYDEAYVRWNEKVPGDLLRIREDLAGPSWFAYERYIDALTDIGVLSYKSDWTPYMDAHSLEHRAGLLSIMDSCLTMAFDGYRSASFKSTTETTNIVVKCKFSQIYLQSISCFSTIAESLYSAVNKVDTRTVSPVSRDQVLSACTPP